MWNHLPVSIGVQLVCWALGRWLAVPTRGAIWLGCFAGSAVCIMREITQREYQWIEQFGAGRRANMPGYAGLELWEWNAHSLSETAVAIIGSVLVALVVSHYAADREN